MKELKCCCGEEGRYTHLVDGEQVLSCNKYAVCPPYDVLEKNTGELFHDMIELLRAVDGLLSYREGTKPYSESYDVYTNLRGKYL